MTHTIKIILLALAALMTGCSATTGGNIFQSPVGNSTVYTSTQKTQSVRTGEVLSVRPVQIVNQPAALAKKVGGALGGLLGIAVGDTLGGNAAKAVGGLIGSAVGVEVGNQAASQMPGQEIIVRLDGEKYAAAKTVAITQAVADGVVLRAGQKVMIIGQGRVAPM